MKIVFLALLYLCNQDSDCEKDVKVCYLKESRFLHDTIKNQNKVFEKCFTDVMLVPDKVDIEK